MGRRLSTADEGGGDEENPQPGAASSVPAAPPSQEREGAYAGTQFSGVMPSMIAEKPGAERRVDSWNTPSLTPSVSPV